MVPMSGHPSSYPDHRRGQNQDQYQDHVHHLLGHRLDLCRRQKAHLSVLPGLVGRDCPQSEYLRGRLSVQQAHQEMALPV